MHSQQRIPGAGGVRAHDDGIVTGPCTVANTLGLPCRAAAQAGVRTSKDLEAALYAAQRDGLAVLPLGAGSNAVLPPRLDALVLRAADTAIARLDENAEYVEVRAGGACDWHGFVEYSLEQEWCGLENLALIPGTVGAAPVQNIGAYGRELEAFVTAVHGLALDTHREVSLSRDECRFQYRDSIFKHALRDRFLITAVDFRLPRRASLDTSYPSLAAHMKAGAYALTPRGVFEAVVDLRRRRLPDPREHPNAGSFFKNPVLEAKEAAAFASEHPQAPLRTLDDGTGKLSAAWLIEASGLRGQARGPVGVSARHALVVENLGGAEQGDVLSLAAFVRDTVRERFGVELQPEPRIYTREGRERGLP